jgi:hypothetical protein
MSIESLHVANPCPITQTAFVDLHNYMLQVAIKFPLLQGRFIVIHLKPLLTFSSKLLHNLSRKFVAATNLKGFI